MKDMPKLRTSSSISKRFKITATKKLLRRRATRSHLLQKKTSNLKRRLAQTVLVHQHDVKILKVRFSYLVRKLK